MSSEKKESAIISKQMFKLLPIQILMAAVPALNAFISGIFANNFISSDSMSVVGLFAPISLILSTISTMLIGGSQIFCAQYLGMNKHSRANGVFTMDLIITTAFAVLASAVLIVMGMFDLTGIFRATPELRPLFNSYMSWEFMCQAFFHSKTRSEEPPSRALFMWSSTLFSMFYLS